MTVGEIIEQFKNEYPYICPKCKGKGKIWYEAEENYAMGGFHNESRHIKCDLCNGHGRTKKEYKPIYKIIRYE